MGTDFLYIFIWWLTLLSLGVIFLPLTNLIFYKFFDRGYIFAKILGFLFLSFVIWFLSSIKILPFGAVSILIVLLLFVLLNGFILTNFLGFKLNFSVLKGEREDFFNNILNYIKETNLLTSFKKIWKIFLFEEILFLVGLIFWSFIRAHEPSIHGLEKFMDFGFINSILKTEYFPPQDIWLPPLSINYYYFGHLITAVLTKLSTIDPSLSYNLMVANIFGLTLVASFSIGANLYHLLVQSTQHIEEAISESRFYLYLSGLISAFLVTMGGNLHTIYIFFQNYEPFESPVPFWQLPLKIFNDGYWYPNATRFIPNTIHEFPIYSFVVSDLHGHVLNIPAVLLFLAIILVIFFKTQISLFWHILLGLLIAIFLMTNVLDGPIYLLVLTLVFFFKRLNTLSIFQNIKATLNDLWIIVFAALAFSLPFWLSFKPFGSGIGVMCAPQFLIDKGHFGPFLFEANHCAPSPFYMLVILWGFAYLLLAGFIGFILKRNILKISNLNESLHASSLNEPLRVSSLNRLDFLVLILFLASTILIIIPEIFYAKDIYPDHYRANTVFKFGYQAFIILGLISGYVLTRLIAFKKLPKIYIFLTLFAFLLVAVYPHFAINSYYGNLQNYQSLDGLKYLQELYPADYKAILYLKKNIKDQVVILEAQGDSYTDYARVSANTGLPTVVGWPVHEWLWRGSYDEAGKRSEDVTKLYESTDLEETQSLLDQYNVSLVFIGQLEKEKYPNLNQDKFSQLGKVIFQEGETVVYKLNR